MKRRDGELDRVASDPLTDLEALWTARGPEELWRALVVRQGRSTTHHWEAAALFRRHHGDGTPEALTTALLLCTDRRLDRCAARLIAGITDTDILSRDDLNRLAEDFLWSDEIQFTCPVSWFGTHWIEIDLDTGKAVKRKAVDPNTPVRNRRSIEPPLRRWAASRVLREDPAAFDAARDRACELKGPHAGAVVAGILDAIEALPSENAARRAVELGLGWPQGSVRILALNILACSDPDAARNLATSDPDQKVRSWIPRSTQRFLIPVPDEDRDHQVRARREPADAQATLFQG